MKKLTVLTAAVAAGLLTFAIGAANGAPLSQRADQGFMTASDKTATPKAGQDAGEKGQPRKGEKSCAVKAKKPASAKAEKVSAKKAVAAKKPVVASQLKRQSSRVSGT